MDPSLLTYPNSPCHLKQRLITSQIIISSYFLVFMGEGGGKRKTLLLTNYTDSLDSLFVVI